MSFLTEVKVKSLSRAQLLATPWTAAYQAPPSMGFSRQEYWNGLPLPSPLNLTSWIQRLLIKPVFHVTKCCSSTTWDYPGYIPPQNKLTDFILVLTFYSYTFPWKNFFRIISNLSINHRLHWEMQNLYVYYEWQEPPLHSFCATIMFSFENTLAGVY